MKKESLIGILYMKFEREERRIFNPVLYIPSDLSEKIINEVSQKALEYYEKVNYEEFYRFEPFPSEIKVENEIDGIVAYRKWKESHKIGGPAGTLLIVLYQSNDTQVEKKMLGLEKIFERFSKKLVYLERDEAPKEEYHDLLRKFRKRLIRKIKKF